MAAMRAAVLAILVLACQVVRADVADELQAQGEELGRQGRWTEAIRQFKSADKVHPNATHVCSIALAYTRREAWPQAELFLSLCHERASAGGALPDWYDDADRQITERLRTADLTAVTIAIKPVDAKAQISVSSFEPDEVFGPRTLHLPRGTHVIVARAQGYPDHTKVVEIANATPREIVIDMAELEARVVKGSPTLRAIGLVTASVGIVGIGLGIKYGLDARSDSDAISHHVGAWSDTDRKRYADGQTADERMKIAYVVGGSAIAAGAVLYYFGTRTRIVPIITHETAGIAAMGRF